MLRFYSEQTNGARFALLAAACLAVAGCGGGKKDTSKPKKNDTKSVDAGLVAVKATAVGWVFEAQEHTEPAKTKVLLSKSDETGATDHTDVGTFVGSCQNVAAEGDDVVVAAQCKAGDKGVKLHVVHRRDELIVLRAYLEEEGDELSFDVIKRVKVPIGAVVKPAQQ